MNCEWTRYKLLYYKSIYYGVISNPDVFLSAREICKTQGGAITNFSPKKQSRNDSSADAAEGIDYLWTIQVEFVVWIFGSSKI